MSATPPTPAQRFHAFVRSIGCNGFWPEHEADWAPLKALMEEGLDVATAVALPLKSTVLHRLAKQARKQQGFLTPAQRSKPFLLLAQLTQGRATTADRKEWFEMSVSWAAMRSKEGAFFEGVIQAFLWGKPSSQPAVAPQALYAWKMMATAAIQLDRPDLLEQVIKKAPENLPYLQGIGYGGPRMAQWLLEHFGEELESDRVMSKCHLEYGPARGLYSHIAMYSQGKNDLGIFQFLEQAIAARRAATALDQVLPLVDARVLKDYSGRPRM